MFIQAVIPLGFLEEIIVSFISVVMEGWVLGTLQIIWEVFIWDIFFDFFDGSFGIQSPFAWGLLIILLMTSAGILFYGARE